ncbi:MAG: EF-P lysine aminoacylase GenX [Deltaproteobacteria bacterium]|nr:EF-P lysine aminoacylase GenX [Deltaproteobacteria bacterium]
MKSLPERLRSDPDLLDCLRARARVLSGLRRFFEQRGFVEVHTPCLVFAPDPALHLDSFRTELRLPAGRGPSCWLATSPEHCMKRLLAAGMERIYSIGPFFRNAELGPVHNPEFIGLEWYQARATVEQTMDLTEELVRGAARELGLGRLERAGHGVDLERPFERLTVREALQRWARVDVPADWGARGLRRVLGEAGIACAAGDSFDDLVNRALVERVEPAMAKAGAVFLTDYPAPMAALARLRPADPSVAERFELFAGGLELCNGYGELTDAAQQRERFEAELEARRRAGREVYPLDEAFLQALEAMPPAGGNALGVDRLLMLLLGKERIEQVTAFPISCEIGSPKRGEIP